MAAGVWDCGGLGLGLRASRVDEGPALYHVIWERRKVLMVLINPNTSNFYICYDLTHYKT